MPIVTSVVNCIFNSQQIPDNKMIGVINPVIKRQKAKSNPDNYHCIMVNSMVGKVADREMVPAPATQHYPMLANINLGFKEKVSCNNTSQK